MAERSCAASSLRRYFAPQKHVTCCMGHSWACFWASSRRKLSPHPSCVQVVSAFGHVSRCFVLSRKTNVARHFAQRSSRNGHVVRWLSRCRRSMRALQPACGQPTVSNAHTRKWAERWDTRPVHTHRFCFFSARLLAPEPAAPAASPSATLEVSPSSSKAALRHLTLNFSIILSARRPRASWIDSRRWRPMGQVRFVASQAMMHLRQKKCPSRQQRGSTRTSLQMPHLSSSSGVSMNSLVSIFLSPRRAS
mmetsp:Transcript_30075/g.57966  ORF Transcript_30075/g.57966 Transcript_30075/m.57966 type:complete len:250 (+) Transcript_30075:364-1113(+)